MKAIGNLHGIGRSLSCSFGVRLSAITYDDLYAGMLLQPGGERLRLPALQQVNWLMAFQIDEDGAVAVPPPQREVVHPEDARRRKRRCLHSPFQP